jgi:hypothetical protein
VGITTNGLAVAFCVVLCGLGLVMSVMSLFLKEGDGTTLKPQKERFGGAGLMLVLMIVVIYMTAVSTPEAPAANILLGFSHLVVMRLWGWILTALGAGLAILCLVGKDESKPLAKERIVGAVIAAAIVALIQYAMIIAA